MTISIAICLPSLSAQDIHCPDQVIKNVPTTVVYGPDLGCGGLNVDMGGVQLEGTSSNCPSFAVIVPAHATTRHAPKSHTYTLPLQTIKVTRLDFACKTKWFLIFPIGSECRRTGSDIVSAVSSYQQYPCSDRDLQE
ncbi:MAG: hypothetical protein ACYTG5_09400 [Planctomycetota bacterium]